MSFVDELQNQIDNADEINNNQEQKRVHSLVLELIKAIKNKAKHSPNSRIIKGYVYHHRDIEYAFSVFEIKEDLPVCNIKQMNADAKKSNRTYVLRDETTKRRVYEPVLCFESFRSATLFKDYLNNQLADLGFTQICNVVKEIPDIWHITESRKGFFHDSIRHSLKTDGVTYVVHLAIQW